MTKFIEIYFHFNGQSTVRRYIINVDEIDRVEEYKSARRTPGGDIQEYTECTLVSKDGTKYILEDSCKEKIIKRLLEL
jgi:hypothetical protein